MFISSIELLDKIQLGEDSSLEFKSELPNRKELASEISAFANTEGGELIIGVNDKRTTDNHRDVPGIELSDLDTIEAKVVDVCRDNINPPVRVTTQKMKIEEKYVLRVEIPRSFFVHEVSGVYFAREGSTKRIIHTEQLARLLQSRSQARIIRFDEQVVPDTDMSTLKEKLYLRFIDTAITAKEREELLLKRRLLAKEGQRNHASVAGILMCHDDSTAYLPNSYIQAVCYRGEIMDANYQIDAKDFTGALDRQITDAYKFVEKHNQVAARKEIGRIDYPQYSMKAVFEALVNAVLHRDYSKASAKIRLFMFSDRLEIYSPGELANTITVDTLLYNQATRNELLARLLSEVTVDGSMGRQLNRKKFLELRGEGVKIILRESKDLSSREPIYKMHGEELLLTIFAAKPPPASS